ncbi:MAG: sugar phosphate nucleotidyltransferase [Lachnospiraceae bacterium]
MKGLEKIQFEILSCLEKGERENKQLTSKWMNQRYPSEHTQEAVNSLEREGMLEKRLGGYKITEKGLEALEPYRVKRAIILAAGFGERMLPLTLSVPKPLVRVRGKALIETLLNALKAAQIPEIIIVRGYLWEMFDGLLRRYPNIKFVQNPLYKEANNISSAYLVRGLLANAYVCEADLLVNNPELIRKYEYETNYLGRYTSHTDDLCFHVSNGVIREFTLGGNQCYHMYGISYWNEEDAKKMQNDLEAAFRIPGGKEYYWDDVPLKVFKEHYSIAVRPCLEGDIIELDTVKELEAEDPDYRN